MLQKLKQPYLLSLFIAVILCTAFTINPDHTFHFNVHDTYFAIWSGHIGFITLIMYLVYAEIYFLMRNYQNYLLSLVHLFSGIPFFTVLFLNRFYVFNGVPRRYYTNAEPSFFDEQNLTDVMINSVPIIFLVGEFVFMVNIIWATAKVVHQKMNQGR